MRKVMTNDKSTKESTPFNGHQGLFSDKAFPKDASLIEAKQSTQNNINQPPSPTNKDAESILIEASNTKTDNKNEPKAVPINNNDVLKLAVVGHTNTGKTSILRTLLRDKYFGEVKNESATTRHVEQALISNALTGQNYIALYDTPGLEDASGVMDWLEDNTASRRDGIERLQLFLASDQANADMLTELDLSQESKVIRQLLASDMAIYVIDAREPVLGKYKDELTVLSWAAIPVMPVFNFTKNQDANIKDWQDMLARRNLHISTRFDSVAFEFNDEMTLWRNLATMLPNAKTVRQLIDERESNWAQLLDDANIIIADFLVNVASFVKEVDDKDDPMPILTEMQEAVRQAERSMQKQLLNLYKFYDSDVSATPLKLDEYQQDPFDPEVLKGYGIRTTSGAAAGALVGLGIDAATLGTSLGLGAAIGGIAGGILSNTGKIAEMISGVKHLHIDPATITLLATRSMDLLVALRHRGHAASDTTPIAEMQEQSIAPWKPERIPSILRKARSKPHWSSLGDKSNAATAEEMRKDAAWALSNKLRRKQ